MSRFQTKWRFLRPDKVTYRHPVSVEKQFDLMTKEMARDKVHEDIAKTYAANEDELSRFLKAFHPDEEPKPKSSYDPMKPSKRSNTRDSRYFGKRRRDSIDQKLAESRKEVPKLFLSKFYVDHLRKKGDRIPECLKNINSSRGNKSKRRRHDTAIAQPPLSARF
eukprot:TRINITY_DN777999_c0_g1_i1.p1 TRINITY_DN777999_c0_g1~~TRINITY_DN777999_c0_g1_i1.p1  ORF type:complete len:164 (-),score=30.85 TRINITY_DN777999_c0_g1_i1:209-700(-)